MLAVSFIAKSPLQNIGNVDTTVNNCGGWTPNSNCSANPNWAMPNGNWWSFPFSVTVLNPSGYTFGSGYGDMPNCGGGSSISYNALTTTNSPNVVSSTVQKLGVHERTARDVNNCNCGPTGTPAAANCYSNCNCSTACNCNCNCACDCSGRC